MSAKSQSSSKKPVLNGVDSAVNFKVKSLARSWKLVLLLPLWIAFSYVASNLILIGVLTLLKQFNITLDSYMNEAAANTLLSVLIYVLTLFIAIALPYYTRFKIRTSLEQMGLTRLVTWTDIGLAPVFFILYIVTSLTLLSIITSVFPGFPIDQAQDVGFKALGSRMDNLLAFVTLVVCAPIAEEALFRGYLYGKLREVVPPVVFKNRFVSSKISERVKSFSPGLIAAIVTSLLFGVAHLQWNVGLDVFVLSMFLCGLRGITGTIWAGILVHMIKNGIAYYMMFVAPLFGMGLGN